MKRFKYKRYFPFSSPRKEQDEAINFAIDAFLNKKKKFVILELSTGVGKSGVALAVARYINRHNVWPKEESEKYKNGAYYLTTQKILQDQYLKDFGPPNGSMESLKSSSNYKCHYLRSFNCSEGLNLLKDTKKDSPFMKACGQGGCVYKCAKKAFLKSEDSVTNFPYFLTETSYVGTITPRKVLVIDEAHNIENEISKFVEITVSENFANRILKINMPKTESQSKAANWVINTYYSSIENCLKDYRDKLLSVGYELGKDSDEFKKLVRQIERLESHESKIKKFTEIYKENNWILNVIPAEGLSGRKFEFKPIDIGSFAEEYLYRYGSKIVLMSATILNKEAFCESVGINPQDAEFLSLDSPFPVENRPIYYLPAGKMNQKDIEKTLPKLGEIVRDILKVHSDEKGIVHCRTFKIARFLKKFIKSNRLLVHSTDDKDKMLEQHLNDNKPTVIVSPSSTEGLDLKGNLSRFQVICKLYYPYLGDKLVLARKQKHKRWYAYQVAKSTVQALGRSVRNEKDHAVSYILDGAWEYFFKNNEDLFPEYFKKSLKEE